MVTTGGTKWLKRKTKGKKRTLQTMNSNSHYQQRQSPPATFNPALLDQRPEAEGKCEIHGSLLHIPCCFLTIDHKQMSVMLLFSYHKLSKNLKISLSDIIPSTRLLPASTMNTRRTPGQQNTKNVKTSLFRFGGQQQPPCSSGERTHPD